MKVQEAIEIFQVVGLLSVSVVVATLAIGIAFGAVYILTEMRDEMKVNKARLPVRIEKAKNDQPHDQ